ncbi:TPA: hypothetical protein U0Z15_000682 [Listeria monocytogenes]|uniref:Uncharacterized protein n=1 Tax=Listeria monocytogenes TaxID=1639 RepID=A0A5Z1J3V1_LISMN|nr:hypothetical protein [Listeria monocytogenes]EAE1679185.1 hypothetical protein [Listeria monocytogenes LIS0071]MCX60370.1 hypothetical protein [Listeria monocytogenes serotype 4b]AGR18841.1 hypothetical protein M640_12350 [Listeria monocytogenes]AGR21502.1 hypothetical protein M644_02570 [Listeria monocytogenes]AGR24609.1 hypothetical protein M645_10610 [Listeria monocytogenes]
MARLPNQYLFVKTVVDAERLFDEKTKSYVVVELRDAYEYADGKITDNVIGKNVTLMCTRDEEDYGVTKAGKKIPNLKFKQFDIKILNGAFEVPKGTRVKMDLGKLEKAVGYKTTLVNKYRLYLKI